MPAVSRRITTGWHHAWEPLINDLLDMRNAASHADEVRAIDNALKVASQRRDIHPAPLRLTAMGELTQLVITLYWHAEEVECTSEEIAVFRE